MSNNIKKCRRCQVAKSTDDFHRRSAAKDGLSNTCKECRSEQEKARYYADLQESKKRQRETYLRNREKRLAEANKAYQNNKEEILEYKRGYYKENRESILEKRVDYYQDNKEKITNYTKEWRKNNPEKCKEYKDRRAAWKNGVEYEPIDREELFKRDNGACYMCKEEVSPLDWHLEHKIPLSRGGSHTYDNTGVSCPPCNQRKRDKTPEECDWF